MSEAASIQIKPLNHSVAPIWDYDTSDYPDRVKIPFENGSVKEYALVVEQPHPKCLKTVEIIQLMKGHTYGDGKHAKKSR